MGLLQARYNLFKKMDELENKPLLKFYPKEVVINGKIYDMIIIRKYFNEKHEEMADVNLLER